MAVYPGAEVSALARSLSNWLRRKKDKNFLFSLSLSAKTPLVHKNWFGPLSSQKKLFGPILHNHKKHLAESMERLREAQLRTLQKAYRIQGIECFESINTFS